MKKILLCSLLFAGSAVGMEKTEPDFAQGVPVAEEVFSSGSSSSSSSTASSSSTPPPPSSSSSHASPEGIKLAETIKALEQIFDTKSFEDIFTALHAKNVTSAQLGEMQSKLEIAKTLINQKDTQAFNALQIQQLQARVEDLPKERRIQDLQAQQLQARVDDLPQERRAQALQIQQLQARVTDLPLEHETQTLQLQMLRAKVDEINRPYKAAAVRFGENFSAGFGQGAGQTLGSLVTKDAYEAGKNYLFPDKNNAIIEEIQIQKLQNNVEAEKVAISRAQLDTKQQELFLSMLNSKNENEVLIRKLNEIRITRKLTPEEETAYADAKRAQADFARTLAVLSQQAAQSSSH